MSHSRLRIITLVWTLGLSSGLPLKASAQEGSPDSVGPTDGASLFQLSQDEVVTFARAALDGNAQAAQRLHMHYQFTTRDGERAVYWMRIAAENGSSESMVGYAIFLFKDKRGKDNCMRARFWTRRAYESGYRDPPSTPDLQRPSLRAQFARYCSSLDIDGHETVPSSLSEGR